MSIKWLSNGAPKDIESFSQSAKIDTTTLLKSCTQMFSQKLLQFDYSILKSPADLSMLLISEILRDTSSLIDINQ